MARKLVLIDQSVTGVGGHHLEYALRVLEPAAEAGLEPVLAVNAAYSGQAPEGVTLHAVFRRTFWQNMRPLSRRGVLARGVLARLRAVRRGIAQGLRRRKMQWRYSRTGITYYRAYELGGPRDELLSVVSGDLTPYSSPRGLLLLFWLFGRVRGKAARVRASLLRRRPVARVLRALWRLARLALMALAGLVLIPFGLLALPLLILALILTRGPSPAAMFRKDTEKLIRAAGLQAGDIVFVPTLGEAELAGISALRAHSPLARALEWRLLLRRDLYRGAPSGHSRQNDNVAIRRLRLLLRQMKGGAGAGLRFYTDTDPLGRQYDTLGAFAFETMPIPVDPAFADIGLGAGRSDDRSGNRAEGALTWGYFGDARDEKGFGRVADLADSLAAAHGGPPARLLAQSNFNTPGGEPETKLAYLRLQAMPTGLVDLAGGPFEGDAYRRLFGRVDAVLIPYDPDAYAARSSGVLAEALVAARPVVVSAGSWMALVMEPYRQAWLRALTANAATADVSRRDRARGESTFGDLGEFALPPGGRHLVLRLTFDRADTRRVIQADLDFRGVRRTDLGRRREAVHVIAPEMILVVEIPAGAIAVRLHIGAHDPGDVAGADAVMAQSADLGDAPCGFAGRIVVAEGGDIAMAVNEINGKMDAYREAAACIRPDWAAHTHPRAMLAVLADGAAPQACPSLQAERVVAAFVARQALAKGRG